MAQSPKLSWPARPICSQLLPRSSASTCSARSCRDSRHSDKINVVAVEPAESPVLSGGQPGSHKIDGIGAGFVVPLWKQEITDQFERVSTDEAISMAFRLAREEGVFAGTSTGANVTATLRLAGKLSPNATIVTVICDAAMKYLKNYSAAINA